MIAVKCPHCKVGLKVDEQKIPKGITSFKCPKCKQEIPLTAIPLQPSVPVSDTNTILLNHPAEQKTGMLTTLANTYTAEQQFIIREGVHIIGRKATTSNADICIETTDRLMSRNHLRLEMKRHAQGGFIYSISDNHSKNRTIYNGRVMDEGEIVVLKNNDEITIGRTTIRFNNE